MKVIGIATFNFSTHVSSTIAKIMIAKETFVVSEHRNNLSFLSAPYLKNQQNLTAKLVVAKQTLFVSKHSNNLSFHCAPQLKKQQCFKIDCKPRAISPLQIGYFQVLFLESSAIIQLYFNSNSHIFATPNSFLARPLFVRAFFSTQSSLIP